MELQDRAIAGFSRVYWPLDSIASGFGNFLETIPAHWQPVIRHIHNLFAPGAYA
jgi:hypothetical protein